MSHEKRFPHVWDELMESVEAAVEAGAPRSEVMAWAWKEYDAHCATMDHAWASEAGMFDEPVFDVQGRL